MRTSVHRGEVDIPEGIEVELRDREFHVRGPLGEISKSFVRVPVKFQISDKTVAFEIHRKGKKGASLVNTIRKILMNLFTGVSRGFTYKMKIYYRHFPISVSVSDKFVTIKNFTGERGSRRAKIVGDASVKVKGDDVIITGLSKEEVALTAANIQRRCEIKRKDPRVFLDGIYLYSKSEGLGDA
ncbi:MAG: 50S ribosomal protein L6 [Candidatus Geothermarchaeales archaeon]